MIAPAPADAERRLADVERALTRLADRATAVWPPQSDLLTIDDLTALRQTTTELLAVWRAIGGGRVPDPGQTRPALADRYDAAAAKLDDVGHRLAVRGGCEWGPLVTEVSDPLSSAWAALRHAVSVQATVKARLEQTVVLTAAGEPATEPATVATDTFAEWAKRMLADPATGGELADRFVTENPTVQCVRRDDAWFRFLIRWTQMPATAAGEVARRHLRVDVRRTFPLLPAHLLQRTDPLDRLAAALRASPTPAVPDPAATAAVQRAFDDCRWLDLPGLPPPPTAADLTPGQLLAHLAALRSALLGHAVATPPASPVATEPLSTDGWLTVTEAARLSGLSTAEISKRATSGEIRSHGKGRARRIDANAIAEIRRKVDEARL